MDHKPKRIISSDEKLDTTRDFSQETIRKTHEELLRDFSIDEIWKEDIADTKKTPEEIIFKKHREYDPDLMESLNHLEYLYREKQNSREILDTIKYILKKYKDVLVRRDYIDIMLKKGFALNESGKHRGAYEELQKISPYEKYFVENQSDDFYAIQGHTLFSLGENEQNAFYFQKSLACFDHILQGANETHQLDTGFYKNIQYKRSLIKIHLKEDEEAISLLQEIVSIPAEEHDEIRINSFYLLGTAFDLLGRYQESIESFKEYLRYKPDDQDIKQYIRILSEKKPE